MSAEHINPKAHAAACKVDPMVLANALDHIARTARASRSQTRRLRWIEQRADGALAGKDSVDDIDLPKNANAETPEKLQKKLSYQIAIRHQLLAALQDVLASEPGPDLNDRVRAAIAKATGAP